MHDSVYLICVPTHLWVLHQKIIVHSHITTAVTYDGGGVQGFRFNVSCHQTARRKIYRKMGICCVEPQTTSNDALRKSIQGPEKRKENRVELVLSQQ